MGLVPKLGVWVPHELTPSQFNQRVDTCMSLLSLKGTFNWLDHLITGDEKWVLYTNYSRKRQWLEPNQVPELTPKPEAHPKKVMLSVWWDVYGVIYWELLPNNTTVTAATYCAQLQKVQEKLLQKHPKSYKIYFLHDNARPHISKVTHKKLLELGWEVLPHPPYSPDLAPTDYHLFRSLSNSLREKSFDNEDSLKQYLTDFFDSRPKEFYSDGIHSLPKRWQEVIDNEGAYISEQ